MCMHSYANTILDFLCICAYNNILIVFLIDIPHCGLEIYLTEYFVGDSYPRKLAIQFYYHNKLILTNN